MIKLLVTFLTLMLSNISNAYYPESNTVDWEILLIVAPEKTMIDGRLVCGDYPLSLEISRLGSVENTRIDSSVPPRLEKSIKQSAALWKFSPRVVDGVPTSVSGASVILTIDCNSGEVVVAKN